MTDKTQRTSRGDAANTRFLMIGVVIALAFVASYAYASTRSAASGTDVALNGAAVPGATQAAVPGAQNGAAGTQGGCCGGAGASGSASGGCCGGGGSAAQAPVAGSTTVTAGIQKVTVDLTTGTYSPNEITAKAGVPIELDFRGPAPSCNGYVQSKDLGFSQDVSNGGTITLPALKAGTYKWACSMNMYTAKLVVK